MWGCPARPASSAQWGPSGVLFWDDGVVYISAKVDYATRVLLALAAAPAGTLTTGEALATAQRVPV